MAAHLKWQYPAQENDYLIHLSSPSAEHTLCGLAYEGEPGAEFGSELQDLITTNRRVTCGQCKEIVEFCKEVRASEFGKID